jgi:hypothetical protein
VKFDLDTHKGIQSVLALKLSVTKEVIRIVLVIGRKPTIDRMILRTVILKNMFLKNTPVVILIFVVYLNG